ncbi:MAG: hypothetical protein JNM00_10320 [Flavobacteriales bacterium]|nr:hypothetical protein [Flavobacteriales bacterium]
MRNLKLLVAASTMLLSSFIARADWDLWQSYIILNSTYYAGPSNADLAPTFGNLYLGSYSTGGSIVLSGGELKTYKDCNSGCSNVCGGDLFYRVYRTCDTAPAFSTFNLPYDSELGGGDQKWDETGLSINLLSGLTDPGTYVVEVYWRVWGGQFGGCDFYKFDPDDTGSTLSSYVPASFSRAYFDLNITDSFTDGNFSASPVWSGDAANFTVVNNSDVSTLSGSEAIRSYTLRLNAPAVSQTEYISTPVTSWGGNQEWYFWMGRRGQAATVANQSSVWLYSDQANLESGTINGYRVRIGDDTGGDDVQLQVVNAGTATTLVSSAEATNGITDWGVAVRVTRSQTGVWTLYTSTIPTSNGSGATAVSCPATDATVLAGTSTNTAFTPSGTGYVGVTATHSTGASAIIGAEFDNFRFVPLPFDTYVNLSASSASVNENDGTHTITVNITHPSATNATSVDLVLTSGSAARINGFSSQTLNFPAGSSASQSVVLTVTDNEDCDDLANLSFQLQSVSGGQNAYIASPSTYALAINDDNMGYTPVFSEDFEDGNIAGWLSSPSAWWEASTFVPCSGTYSARSADVNVAGQSTFTTDLDDVSLLGVTTTWRFNVRYNSDPSPNNKFQVFLAANETSLFSSTVDGYAVGVNPVITGDPDIITLWRVENGAFTSAIITSAIDWGNGAATSEVGFEITRSENGYWTLKVDENGDFDNLQTIGSSTDGSFNNIRYFGVRYLFTAGLDNALAFDDISISQKGCQVLYYSQGSGSVNDPIWDDVPVGIGGVIDPGRYTRLRVQSGHTVVQSGALSTDDFAIDNGGIFISSPDEHRVYGNWVNDGTYTAGGQVTFKGDENQFLLGSSVSSFKNLKIDNNGFSVTPSAPVEVTALVSPDEGTFNANGNLTLVSTSATSAGSIGEIKAGADVIGNITMQRYIPSWTYNGIGWNQGGTWVHLACPLNGSLTLADWNDDMVTTGFSGSDYPPPYSFVNIRTYNEATPGLRDIGYVDATNITNPLSGGYFVFLPYSAHTVDATGTINKGSYSQTVQYTNTGNGANDGWNLLPNLAPSEMDWNLMAQNGAGVTTYYRFDRDLPGYRPYNGITQAGTAGRYIPSGMSFFTYANPAAGTIAYAEAYKSNTNAAYDRNQPESSVLYLRLENEGLADEAVVTYLEGTSADFELAYDAVKVDNDMVTEAPELAFISSDNNRLTLHTLTFDPNQAIPVWIKAPVAGMYTLVVSEMKNLPAGACFTVHDLVSGEVMAIDNGAALSFELNEAFTGVRFMIENTAAPQVLVTPADCQGQTGSIQWNAEGLWNCQILNGLGEVVVDANSGNVVAELESGAYTLVADRSDDLCAAFEMPVVIDAPAALAVEPGSIVSVCNDNVGVIEFKVAHAGGYSFSVTDFNGQMIASGNATDFAQRIEGLAGSVYTVTVMDNCSTIQHTVDTRDPNAVNVEVIAPVAAVAGEPINFDMIASGTTDVQWSVDGQWAAASEAYTHTFEVPSQHIVTANVSNAICNASQSIIVNVKSAPSTEQVDVTVLPTAQGWTLVVDSETAMQTIRIEVVNAAGQMIVERTQLASNRIEIEGTNLATGLYTYRLLKGADVVATGKLVR